MGDGFGWDVCSEHLQLHCTVRSARPKTQQRSVWQFYLVADGTKEIVTTLRLFFILRSQQHLQVRGSLRRAVLLPGCLIMDGTGAMMRRSARRFNIGCSAQRRRSRKLLRSDLWRQQLSSSSSVLEQALGSSVSRYDVGEEQTATQRFTLCLWRLGRRLDRKSHWRCDIVNSLALACHVRTQGLLWNGDTSTRMCGYK